MKKRLLFLGCGLLTLSSLMAQQTLQVTVSAGGADVAGTLPAQVAAAVDNDIIEISNEITEDVVVSATMEFSGKAITIIGNEKTIRVEEPHVSTYRIFSVENGGLKISNCTIKGGFVNGTTVSWTSAGATIRVKGIKETPSKLTLENVNFIQGKGYAGGALGIWDYTEANITNCLFTEQESVNTGGAAINVNATSITTGADKPLITINGCTFKNIIGKSVGGAVVSVKANLHVKNSSFTNNVADYGGALATDNLLSFMKIENCYIANNRARKSAGGVFNKSDDANGFEMINTTIIGNTIDATSNNWQDGAGFSTQTGGRIVNCTFVGNISENRYNATSGAKGKAVGAGVWLQSSATEIHTTFINNIVAFNYNKNGDQLTADDIAINGKTAAVASVCNGSNNILGTPLVGSNAYPIADNMTENRVYNGIDLLFKDMENGMPVAKDNGGNTLTVALVEGSIAASAGIREEGIPVTDQRGFFRSDKLSIGAFEFKGVNSEAKIENKGAKLSFYPNPATTEVNLETAAVVKIYSNGALVKDSQIAVENVNVEDLAVGFYIISIDGKGSVLSIVK